MADTEDKKDEVQENLTAERLGDSEARNFAVEGNDLSGYIGVDPEYMTYADETHKPYSTDEEVLPPAEQLMFEEGDDEDDEGDDPDQVPNKTQAEVQAKDTPEVKKATAEGASKTGTASTASKSAAAK